MAKTSHKHKDAGATGAMASSSGTVHKLPAVKIEKDETDKRARASTPHPHGVRQMLHPSHQSHQPHPSSLTKSKVPEDEKPREGKKRKRYSGDICDKLMGKIDELMVSVESLHKKVDAKRI